MSKKQPDDNSHPSKKDKQNLSLLAGAGSGSGLAMWLDALQLTPTQHEAALAVAPCVSILVAWAGPYVARFATTNARYYGVQFFLARQKRLVASIPDDEANKLHKENAQANVRELEAALMEINQNAAKSLTITTQSTTKTPIKNRSRSNKNSETTEEVSR